LALVQPLGAQVVELRLQHLQEMLVAHGVSPGGPRTDDGGHYMRRALTPQARNRKLPACALLSAQAGSLRLRAERARAQRHHGRRGACILRPASVISGVRPSPVPLPPTGSATVRRRTLLLACLCLVLA